jgi:hypothetical protein
MRRARLAELARQALALCARLWTLLGRSWFVLE